MIAEVLLVAELTCSQWLIAKPLDKAQWVSIFTDRFSEGRGTADSKRTFALMFQEEMNNVCRKDTNKELRVAADEATTNVQEAVRKFREERR